MDWRWQADGKWGSWEFMWQVLYRYWHAPLVAQLLSKAVTFMIENAEKLFEIPEKLCIDVSNYVNRKDKFTTPKNKKGE